MKDRTKMNTEDATSDKRPEELANTERREALKKMGRFAAYTAPAAIAILAHKKGHACS